jgi:hypothetical protein
MLEAACMDAEEALYLIKEIQNKQLEENYKTSLLLWSNREAACIAAGVKPPEAPKSPLIDGDEDAEEGASTELSSDELMKLLESD